jgi:hypothetical protein
MTCIPRAVSQDELVAKLGVAVGSAGSAAMEVDGGAAAEGDAAGPGPSSAAAEATLPVENARLTATAAGLRKELDGLRAQVRAGAATPHFAAL